MEPDKLFVYGILVREEDKEAILPNYEKFYRFHATIKKKEGSFVVGKVIENVTDEDMEHYDKIEGTEAGYYHRFVVDIEYPQGEFTKAWVYQQVEDKEE